MPAADFPEIRPESQQPRSLVAMWLLQKPSRSQPVPDHAQPRSSAAVARRLFFNARRCHGLGLTAPVEAPRSARALGNVVPEETETLVIKGSRSRKNRSGTAEKLEQGCGQNQARPHVSF